jgi:3D (Asp-Asp-Asp) domain-containing protein
MRKIITLLAFLTIVGCYPTPTLANNSDSKMEIMARVTYYWPGNGGQSGRKTATGNIATGGKTAAVDPKIIPYGSKIIIPKMEKVFVAHDTGSAVVSRKASKNLGKNNVVIDIFCENRAEAQRKIKSYPMFMKIQIEKPKK